MVPMTTPREPLYMETGLVDIKHITMKNRINMEKRINQKPDGVTFRTKESNTEKGWHFETKKIKKSDKINESDMQGSKERVTKIVENKIIITFKMPWKWMEKTNQR